MEIDFYQNFYKKRNSTKRPTVGGVGNLTEVHTVTGHLKEPCSILHPVISLQGQNPFPNNEPPDFYRYAYIPRFSRYYWVDDWTWDNGLWVVTLDVDVLATYKPHIGEQTEYILRHDSSTDEDYNGYITDIMYPATNDFVLRTEYSGSDPFTADMTDGCYVVGIISGDSAHTIGAISYYAMNPTQFGVLKDKLLTSANLATMDLLDANDTWNVTDMSEQIFKTMYNPYQYIASCMWFPFTVNSIPDLDAYPEQIKLGWWTYSAVFGYKIYNTVVASFGESIGFTSHPQSSRGLYLNYAPYTKRTLIARFGTLALDTSCIKLDEGESDTLSITYLVDVLTGQCLTRFAVGEYYNGEWISTKVIAERVFMLGVPVQIAQIGTDYLGTVTTAVSSVGSTFSSAMMGTVSGGIVGGVMGAISGVASGIYNTLQASMPQLETNGANGSPLSCYNRTKMVTHFYRIVDEDIAHKGRPLCELRRIDTMIGFILCADGEIDMDCYDSERTEIVKFLTSGFFWE